MSAACIISLKLNKLWKIRSSPLLSKKNVTITRNYNTIKRDLFGPISPIEIKKLFQDALQENSKEEAINMRTNVRLNSPLMTVYYPFVCKRIIGSEGGIIVPEARSFSSIFFKRPSQKPLNSLWGENMYVKNDGNTNDIDFDKWFHVTDTVMPFDFSEIRENLVGRPENRPPASGETLKRKKNQKT
uniref:Uncharacterized protein n=1 Tax=Glossina austeni TaxID=7395 RepID=A0A1A9ULW2_GLOAU